MARRVARLSVRPRFLISTTPSAAAVRSMRFMSSEVPPALTMFTEQEEMLRDTVSKFAQNEIQPLVSKMDHEGRLDKGLLKSLFEQGLMGVEIPPEYDGNGMSFTEANIVIEELAKVDPAISVIVDIQNTLLNKIMMKHASESLKAKYLPRLATDTLGSFCLSEASSGSDAFAMKTTAKLTEDGSHYVINGTKLWISNAEEAGFFLVFANANPDASPAYKGITAFAVDKDMAGMTIGKKEDKLGIRASSTCELHFEDLRVPVENVVGEVGKGYKIAIQALNEGRIGIGAQMLGLAQGVFDVTIPYLKDRKQFGTAIADFQGMQHQYAQVRTEIEAARLLVYNAARLCDNKKPFIMESAMSKLYASQIAEKSASKCIEWCGGVGFTKGE